MAPCTVKNPVVTVNGREIVFPVEMQSGSYLEFDAENDCILYGPKGETVAKVRPDGEAPVLFAGENNIRFSCDGVNGPAQRVKLTLISHGEPL
jgi:hypothetical protein